MNSVVRLSDDQVVKTQECREVTMWQQVEDLEMNPIYQSPVLDLVLRNLWLYSI